jgi:hypothetical protein
MLPFLLDYYQPSPTGTKNKGRLFLERVWAHVLLRGKEFMHIGKHQLRREQPKKKKQRSGKHDLSHCLNKIWQWGIAGSDLLKTFLVNVGDKLDGQQAISLKQESILLFPNMPGGQQNKRVEVLAHVLVDLPPAMNPPIYQRLSWLRGTIYWKPTWRRRNFLKTEQHRNITTTIKEKILQLHWSPYSLSKFKNNLII